MLNIKNKGLPRAIINGGENNGKIISIDENEKNNDNDNNSNDDNYDNEISGFDEIDLNDGKLNPLMDFKNRGVYYIAGPSGSGKTTYTVNLIKDYLKMYPTSDFFLFSRTDYKGDPAFKGMRISQIKLDEQLLENPIDIEKEISQNSILFFDDCNTVQNENLKKYVEKLMCDIMEVGRRLQINIMITNHLVIPNERKFARTCLNEIQYLTVFPKSGSSQQITYVLKTYFGLNNKQIQKILSLKSRWVTVIKQYPMTVMYDKGIYIL